MRHAHLRLFNRETLLGQRFGDVGIGDGTEQAAIDAGLLGNLDGQAVQLLALSLGSGQLPGSCLFQVGASVARRAMRFGIRKLRA
jgi:hypothetical protein